MRQIGVFQRQRYEDQIRSLLAENAALKQQSDAASSTQKSLKSTVSSLREQIQMKEAMLMNTQALVQTKDDRFNSVIAELKTERDALQTANQHLTHAVVQTQTTTLQPQPVVVAMMAPNVVAPPPVALGACSELQRGGRITV